MAEPGISGRSELRVMIRDTYLAAHANEAGSGADIDIINLAPVEAFLRLVDRPGRGIPRSGVRGKFDARFISINNAGQNAVADVNGQEQNDPYFLVESFTPGVLHSCSFKKIRPNGTTARGIIIHA